MNTPKLDRANRYLLTGYQQQKPFASFLPGIAGPTGIPMWVFYVNRGQAISSFGIESKDAPIMEFQPANKAYQVTPYAGFRTFLKLTRGAETQAYEPFANREPGTAQQMAVGANELEIEETAPARGLKTNILYYTLPGEEFAGLVRRVTLQNMGQTPLSIEMLDGLPALIPFGLNNGLLKELGRTAEAWMQVHQAAACVPFYGLSASVVDRAEVETYKAGHFALAVKGQELLPVLVDPAVVFESDTSFTHPLGFERQPIKTLLAQRQITCGRTPCAFFAHQAVLQPGEALTFYSLYGHISGQEILQRHIPRIAQAAYFESKYAEAAALADDLTSVVETRTADPVFDAYCRQNFLDNVLRGGWPVLFGSAEQQKVFPVYSRKHGDQERDYNAYFIAPEPYSQGEGSYRDINQNRRDTVLQNPRIGDFDIRTFLSLIQTDGYNPRTVKGYSFRLSLEKQAAVLSKIPGGESLRDVLAKPFTPGKLLKYIADHAVRLPISGAELLEMVIPEAEQRLEADFFEGYWIDHWEYCLDLVENYLAVYPDRQNELLFGRADLPFYESAMFVQPRAKKYVLSNGLPRQIGSLRGDAEKSRLIASRADLPNWTRTDNGQGEIYRVTVFAKMALIALLKFATLDPAGMGIEMEAGRPGWYDALNGLPALFGSGLAETYELQRWLAFLRAAIPANPGGVVRLPVEVADLLAEVERHLASYNGSADKQREFIYWDAVSTARETYRQRTRLGVSGEEKDIPLNRLEATLAAFEGKVAAGIARAETLNDNFPPTYLTFHVDDYEVLDETDPDGRPLIHARRFLPEALPLFLEGPVRAMKVQPDTGAARKLYGQVKNSPLFDAELKMYKVNASLADQPHDIGRARAFPPGWLENESIWLHMEYKYLLETLKAGLYEEFFADFRSALVPFLDPQVYGRSPLENVSFLASSAHPDPAMHGTGFVARLSGSTAEFQSMWNVVMAGKQPFIVQDGQLCLALRPALPGWLFTESGEVSFRFLGCCTVTYHNPQRLDTFREDIAPGRIVLSLADGRSYSLDSSVIGAPYAAEVRAGNVARIDVFF